MGDKSKVYAGAEDQDNNIKGANQPTRIFDVQKKQDGKPVNLKDFEDFNKLKGGEGGATFDADRAVLYGTPSYLDYYKYPGNKIGFEYIAFGSQGLAFRNACMYNMCSTFSCICCNDACAGCFGPVAPCINQYHCTFQHYPDCGCKKDVSMSVTGHNYKSVPKPDAVLGPDLFKFFEFSRKLAEMSYETSYKQLLVPDGKGSFITSSPPLYTRAERGYADKYLKTKDGVCQIKPGTMTIWRNHTTVAITCVCTNVPGKDVNDEVITVIFQGTGAGAESLMSISLTDAWYDSISSHTTDFWGSNGENLGRVGVGFYLSYNMIRRQDNATRSMVAYTEGPLADLERVSKIPGGGSYLGGGLVEYVKNWALDHKRNDVYIVGHSLGGSMAQICAADLAFGVSNGKDAQGKHIPVFKKITLVTYGSPRALGHELAAMVDKAVTHYRLVNALDPVPQHPLYGTEDPMGLTASLNAGYNNFNLGYHRMNQSKTTYEDPYVKKCNAKFERKRSQIEEAAGLLGGQKLQRELARMKSRRPKDVNSGKFLGITRHFGRVFYADPVPVEKLASGAIPVVWREMDFDDFCGDNEKLKRVMKDKTKEYDGVVRKVDNFDGLDATGKKTLDPKRVVTPYSDTACYGMYKRTVEYDEEDDRYFRTTDVCTGGCLKNSLAAKPIPIEIDLEKTKVLSCGEKTGVCVIRCLEESVDNFLDIIEFMNELPYWCRALNYMIPCCFTVRKQIQRVCGLTTSSLTCCCISCLRCSYMFRPPGFPGGIPHPREAYSHSLGDSIQLDSKFYDTAYTRNKVRQLRYKETLGKSDPISTISTSEEVFSDEVLLHAWVSMTVKSLTSLTGTYNGTRGLEITKSLMTDKSKLERTEMTKSFEWMTKALNLSNDDAKNIIDAVQGNWQAYTTLADYADEAKPFFKANYSGSASSRAPASESMEGR